MNPKILGSPTVQDPDVDQQMLEGLEETMSFCSFLPKATDKKLMVLLQENREKKRMKSNGVVAAPYLPSLS